MPGLLYRPDWEQARRRLTKWWNGGDIGRPAMAVTAPRQQPVEDIPPVASPDGDRTCPYTTKSVEYRVNRVLRDCASLHFLGEAVPYGAPGDVGPNSLALYLGCEGEERPDTTWFRPFIQDPDRDGFDYDPHNRYWTFTLEATRRANALGRGRLLQQFPDFIEGLDTLAAMRGTLRLLTDLIERPAWVHRCLRRITDLYFRYYDIVYELIRDDVGGSVFWLWAPGRLVKLQCDFSAMISPAMFREFMLPVLAEMTERVGYSLYHWDGPGALCHHDALLSLPRLGMIQWQPGAGAEPAWHRRWWPMYHKTLEAGKKLMIWADTSEQLLALKREFGERSKQMYITVSAATIEQGQEALRVMGF